jgi:uncharacterized membrane protein
MNTKIAAYNPYDEFYSYGKNTEEVDDNDFDNHQKFVHEPFVQIGCDNPCWEEENFNKGGLDDENGFNFNGNYSVITQPPHHIVKGEKIVPIVPISLLVIAIVCCNLISMMVFVDQLARLAVGTVTGYGLWGPAIIILFVLGANLVCKSFKFMLNLCVFYFNNLIIFVDKISQTTVLLGLLTSLILQAVGIGAAGIILYTNQGCRDTSRCSTTYIYGWFSFILILNILSFFLILVLGYFIQYKVKWSNKCEELCNEKCKDFPN